MIAWVCDVSSSIIKYKSSLLYGFEWIGKIMQNHYHNKWLKAATRELFEHGLTYDSLMRFASLISILQEYKLSNGNGEEYDRNISGYVNSINDIMTATVTYFGYGRFMFEICLKYKSNERTTVIHINIPSNSNSNEIYAKYETSDPDNPNHTLASTYIFNDVYKATTSISSDIVNPSIEVIELSIEMYLSLVLRELEERL